MPTNRYAGVDNLLTPDNHALLLIDHQYLQLMSLTSHKPATVSNNATAVAKAAKVFGVPTLLTTAFAERQALLKEIQAVFPEQKPIDRTGLNSWDDTRVSIGSRERGAGVATPRVTRWVFSECFRQGPSPSARWPI
jgi:hypothetical protein